MLVIEGTSKTGIGKPLAAALNADFVEAGQRIFPDGESEITIDDHEEGEDVVLVQTTYPFQDKKLLELYLMAHEMKMRKVKSITAVVPYLAYARQDRHFEDKNNIVSIAAVLEMLGSAGVSKLVIVTPHKKEPLTAFNGEIAVVDPINELAGSIRGEFRSPFILAPDKGALDSAKAAAGVLGCGYAHIDKQRDRDTGDISILNAPKEDIEGKDVIVIDDMIILDNKGNGPSNSERVVDEVAVDEAPVETVGGVEAAIEDIVIPDMDDDKAAKDGSTKEEMPF